MIEVCACNANRRYCGRTVAKLYGAARLFACRHCYRLVYAIQHEDRIGRILQRANKIRMRLGGDPGTASPFPCKPKWMRGATYERLQEEVWKIEEAIPWERFT